MHEFTSALTGGRRGFLEDFRMDAYQKRDLHDALWRSHGGFDLVMAPALPGNIDSTTITRTRTVSILG